MGIAHRDTYKALQTLKFCMHIRWDCAAISQKRGAISQAVKAMLVSEIMSMLFLGALVSLLCLNPPIKKFDCEKLNKTFTNLSQKR